MRNAFIALLVLVTACGEEDPSGQAPDPIKEIVAGVVKPYVDPAAALTDASKTVGLVVAALGEAGEGTYGFGETSAGSGVIPDGDTVFQIGSVSKALTGLILAQQVAEGGLARSALVEALLPALAGSNGTKKVTLGMLAAHHSGLESMPTNLPKNDPISPATGYTLAALKTYLFGLAAPVAAGKAYKYSNLGIGLLGLGLEKQLKVTGYNALLVATLRKELGITDLWGQVNKLPALAMSRLAQGYANKGTARVAGHPGQMGVLAGAGEALTTGKIALLLLETFTGQRAGALDAAVAEWVKPIKPMTGGDSIAYALEVQPDGGGHIYKKAGNTAGGYSAYLAFRRDKKVGVFVMANVASFKGVKTMALTILEKLAAQ